MAREAQTQRGRNFIPLDDEELLLCWRPCKLFVFTWLLGQEWKKGKKNARTNL